ncbi:hypothetical protein OG596_03405 [Streptomyces sp. NBC_01102]|uniref:hypothetical protein n=1 Tax=unclassified Streptomyces TaxID=2593676 RepID=UPI00386B6794|nr:hypothetical protein OG596_03405 [Streptomyces sp. NBC_01102]
MLDAPTERFVAAVGKLPPDVLAEVFEHSLLLYPGGGREAALALKLSASEFSELNRAVASALLPRAGALDAFREGLHSDAKAACNIAARAVRTRATLAEEHYRVLTAPFTAAGDPAPAHPVTPTS